MPHERRLFGDSGEELAVAFFAKRGFSVVTRNWSCPLGEIDLVIEKEGRTHFVEVKTRHSHEFGYPEESITGHKLRKLARAIEAYLDRAPVPPRDFQVDALAISILPNAEPAFHYVEFIL